MGLNVKKQLARAERLLKQGKVPDALLELERLADGAPNDVLTLNRIGDLLAKQGRRDEAIRFYGKIADQFAKSGFLPKAVAIHKKILRLNARHIASLVDLGMLYFQQKLPGEARTYLLRAADQYLQAQNFSKAREVYERLVQAEPDDPRHRARLAEARAAEGQTAAAGEELLELADTLFAGGQPEDAEKAYRRAAELLPDRDEPLIGLVRSLGEQGRNDEALSLLDDAEKSQRNTSVLLGERVLRFEQVGRGRDAAELLKLPSATEIDDHVLAHVFRFQRDRGDLNAVWERYDPLFARIRAAGHLERLVELHTAIAEIEPDGHIPALERLLDVHREREDADSARRILEQLVLACRARSRSDDEERYLEELSRLAPDSTLIRGERSEEPSAAPAAVSESADPVDGPPTPAVVASDVEGDPPIEAEAPAVPLSRTDEDYVSGRMTQTEILEKYGLREQALEQLKEVTDKFPGHVPAQERRVELEREGGRSEALREALVALALARRAAGDASAAREACAEATRIGGLDAATTRMLGQLGLIDLAAAAVDPPAESSTSGSVAAGEPAPEPSRTTVSTRSAADGSVLIDFDEMDDDEEPPIDEARESAASSDPLPASQPAVPAAETPSPGGASRGTPADDVLAEIEALVEQGSLAEAERRLEALETLGWGGAGVAALRARVDGAKPQASPSSDLSELDAVSLGDDDEADDDLSAITAALESELFADDTEPVVAEPESEQSLEDVFAAFKAQVEEEVESDDYRTHYDLGIAYKEMGLLDEAVSEFERSMASAELGRESYTMLALCHRDRDDLAAAADAYREAIERSDGDTAMQLRYELADLLVVAGDREGALDQFRHLAGSDPGFRDVRDRLAELESFAS